MDHDHGDSDLVPHSSDDQKPRGLFVKFKIPKTSFNGDDQEDGSDREGHVCHFCSKKFSSGKALGGHVRVHMINTGRGKKKPTRSYLRPKLEEEKEVMKVRSSSSGGGDCKGNMIKCCLCSKEFRSMKSLFGHMRNHPERGWRGIRPPPENNINNSCSSSLSENEQLVSEVIEQRKMSSDLVEALPKGPEIARKRRMAETVWEDEVPEAAYILMKLAYSGQSLDLGKFVRNPSFVYDGDEEEVKLGQLKGEVIKEKKKKKKKREKVPARKLKLDFDLNQPYFALDGEGTLDHN